jgi:hypothetical protein
VLKRLCGCAGRGLQDNSCEEALNIRKSHANISRPRRLLTVGMIVLQDNSCEEALNMSLSDHLSYFGVRVGTFCGYPPKASEVDGPAEDGTSATDGMMRV